MQNDNHLLLYSISVLITVAKRESHRNLYNYTGMEKIHTVSTSLKPASGKWKSFAAGIGIQAGTIEKIEEKFHDPGRCLNVVIHNWFNGMDAAEQKYKKLTWRSIINVLQSPIVNECTLADKIMSTQG